MRRTTVRKGLYGLSCSLFLISLLTFYQEQVALIFQLSLSGQSILMFWGFFATGVQGCTSILVIISGILQTSLGDSKTPLLPAVVALIVAIMLFGSLLFSSLQDDTPPRLRPGESITI